MDSVTLKELLQGWITGAWWAMWLFFAMFFVTFKIRYINHIAKNSG